MLLAVAAGVAVSAVARTGPSHPGRLELLASAKKTVTLKGVPVTGLYPGASKTLMVTVKNGNHFKIKLATVKTTVAAKTSLTGCTGAAKNLTVARPTGTLTIAPMKSRQAHPHRDDAAVGRERVSGSQVHDRDHA